ncbi:hypothetical protein RhiirC2_792540 [Rhizophagus irregularis]|uniref:SAM domain-containing protein n=1 Tax=Rhizophagus irregularis TaxID=588596 RepID=A0A2N1MH43_9GLOM|nr:hypothetical protein RhiirC2_792540 [Rhizophagus irregularis]
MSDVVKDFNTEELIDYSVRKNLILDKDDIKILRKEKISGLAFLELTEEKFRSIGLSSNNTCKIYRRPQSEATKLFLAQNSRRLERNVAPRGAFEHCMEDIILKVIGIIVGLLKDRVSVDSSPASKRARIKKIIKE